MSHSQSEYLRPLSDRVLVREDVGTSITAGGIYVPAAAQEPALMGEIVAVGPGRWTRKSKFVPTTLAIGDRVVWGKYTGSKVLINGYPYSIIREMEILGRIDHDED